MGNPGSAVLSPPSFPDYPFASHFLPLDGGRLHYLEEGIGEPLLLLHGNPTWSFYYRHLVLGLRDRYRLIVPDHIGCGLSDKPEDARYPYTLTRRVADIEALLDHLGVRDNLTLVVHDWGGMIGMSYATQHPQRIRRLVILNTAAFRLPAHKKLPWSLWWCRNTPLGPWLVRGLNAFCRGAARYCTVRPLSPEVRNAYLAPYAFWRNRIAILRFVQDIPLRPGDPAYEEVCRVEGNLSQLASLPVLLCWGERDFVFDQPFLDEWQRRFPDAEVHRFPGAGHYVLEDAGPEILALVRDFLQRHPLSPKTTG
jgi:pimeloyl-ACP methyl ester carboxylesterase